MVSWDKAPSTDSPGMKAEHGGAWQRAEQAGGALEEDHLSAGAAVLTRAPGKHRLGLHVIVFVRQSEPQTPLRMLNGPLAADHK